MGENCLQRWPLEGKGNSSLVPKDELAQRRMNRSFALMLGRAEYMGVDGGEMRDVVAVDFASSLLTNLVFSMK